MHFNNSFIHSMNFADQNTGGMELADRLLGGPFNWKSIADVVATGEMDSAKGNAQLAGLLRMCRDRVVSLLATLFSNGTIHFSCFFYRNVLPSIKMPHNIWTCFAQLCYNSQRNSNGGSEESVDLCRSGWTRTCFGGERTHMKEKT